MYNNQHINSNPQNPVQYEFGLLPYQLEHFNNIITILQGSHFYIDGSPMGSGKTHATCEVSKYFNVPKFIVAPLIAHDVWRKAQQQHGSRILDIITYESLRSITGHQPKHGYLIREDIKIKNEYGAKTGSSVNFYPTSKLTALLKSGVLIVFDECQKIKNNTAQSKAARAIVSQLLNEGGSSRVAFLTGTMLENGDQAVNFLRGFRFITARNLYSRRNGEVLLEGLQELFNWAALINKPGYDAFIAENALNIDAASEYILNVFIQVIKPKVMSIMPFCEGKPRGTLDIKNGFYKLTREESMEYDMAISELKGALNYNSSKNTVRYKSLGSIQNAHINCQNTKIGAVVRQVDKVMRDEPNCKVIIFAGFYEIMDKLKEFLELWKPKEVSGRLNSKFRNSIITEFNQTDLSCRLLICNPEVCGICVSLDDKTGYFPRHVFIFPSYKVSLGYQTTFRAYRSDTVGTVTCRFVYAMSENSSEIYSERNILAAFLRKGNVLGRVHQETKDQGFKFPDEYESEIVT